MYRKLTFFSVAIISAIVFLTYYPALKIGFMGDDWAYLKLAMQKPFIDYLIQYFNPAVQFIWYRPMIGILWWLEYILFDADPTGYHAVGMLLHLANCLLLFALVKRISGTWRLGFVAATIYSGWALFSQAIMWPSDSQVEASFFFLLAIWFWLLYWENTDPHNYVLTLFFSILAILSKETSIILPIILFLIDRLIFCKSTTWKQLFKHYISFILIVLLYLGLEFRALNYGVFPKQAGYSLGTHIILNLIDYLTLIVFPWDTFFPAMYFWLVFVVILFLWFTVRGHSRVLVFLGLACVLTILPILPFPRVSGVYGYMNPRYSYMPMMVVSIILALVVELGWRTIRQTWCRTALSLIVLLLVLNNASRTIDAAGIWAEASRVERLPFRNITMRHPMFPDDTFLYFIDTSTESLSTMFLIRYGSRVSVSDIFTASEAELRSHQTAIIISVNEQGDSQEFKVDKKAVTYAKPSPPAIFEESIELVNYELANARIQRGEKTALLLYWRANQKVEKDYTVFVHLVDAHGNILDARDSQPRDGRAPTSKWKPGELYPDGVLISIPSDTPIGTDCHLEIGLYYLPTMQRLSIANLDGNPTADQVIIGSIQVIE